MSIDSALRGKGSLSIHFKWTELCAKTEKKSEQKILKKSEVAKL